MLLHVTPDQLQKWMESFLHADARRPAGLERWFLRHRSASKSLFGTLLQTFASKEDAWSAKRKARKMAFDSEVLKCPIGDIDFLLDDMAFAAVWWMSSCACE